MRKLITIIAILSLIIAVPASSAFAKSNHHNNNNTTINDSSTNASADAQADATATGGNSGANSSIGDINLNMPESKDLTTVQNNGHGYRGFNNPAEITYPGMPSYFGPSTRNSNVQPAKPMVMFKDTFTRAEIESYLNGTRVEHNRAGEEIADADKTADQSIKVILIAPDKDTVLQTALITTSAKNTDTESKDVLFAALLTGLDSGADLLLITSEGASTILKSFGWGIGLSYTRATLSADEATGGVGAGGLGISGGTAGYNSLPWIQAIGLRTVN